MSDCMEFSDYLEAWVHEPVKENTFARDWARAKVPITKSLGQLVDNRSKLLEGFAGTVCFRGCEGSLVEYLIGYTLTEKVSLNVGSRDFERAPTSQRYATNPHTRR